MLSRIKHTDAYLDYVTFQAQSLMYRIGFYMKDHQNAVHNSKVDKNYTLFEKFFTNKNRLDLSTVVLYSLIKPSPNRGWGHGIRLGPSKLLGGLGNSSVILKPTL